MVEYNKEHMAKVFGSSLPISPKKAMEICSLLRNKRLSIAKERMQQAIEKKKAIPFTRFNHGLGHKVGMGPGRFPIKTASEVLKLLNSLEANAQFKGLDTNSLVIVKMVANRAPKTWRYGRQRRRVMKRAHVEILAEERKAEEKKPDKGKKVKK
ncbi:50S ribosomal protein L22 [Candidatus Woesearchaeota archaeon]|nr:50S ribosomal protein L22 [Candidatus Woesearchaeota archaeon]